MVILMLFAFTACEEGGTGSSDGSPSGPTTYDIGDIGPSGVGIVFYISDDDGLQGMEVAPYDQSTSAAWISFTTTIDLGIIEMGTSVGTGKSNTDLIMDNRTNWWSVYTGSAAQICRDYRGGGLVDWFLPSKDELNLIWDNLVDDGFGNNSGVAGFSDDYYWSSSKFDVDSVYRQSFRNGYQASEVSNWWARVRAVRSF